MTCIRIMVWTSCSMLPIVKEANKARVRTRLKEMLNLPKLRVLKRGSLGGTSLFTWTLVHHLSEPGLQGLQVVPRRS